MAEIVLDKSYLDGASSSAIAALCDTYQVLFPEQLLFELLTTRLESQRRCFGKFPDQDQVNAVALIPNVGSLMRFEATSGQPCVPLFARRIEVDFVFNRKLREGTYVPEGQVLQDLSQWQHEVQEDAKDFLVRCQLVHQFFPELNGIEYKVFPAAVDAARTKVANDLNFVRTIYSSFLDQDAPAGAPSPEQLNEKWAWFRWIQCQLLAALRIFKRYQGRIPEPPTPNILRRGEHSMHDVYYVILGSLAGTIASRDAEILEDFRLVSPDGTAVSI